MSDFLFRGNLAKLDADVYQLTQVEAERQARKLILIPSESTAPMAVREALASAFQNIYAEGYPDEDTRWMSEEEILDYPARLAHYRRSGDPRYYKGVEYADAVEALARKRAAQAFAANGYKAEPDLRQRAGALGRTRQQRGLPGAGQPGRHDHGAEPAARRAPLARVVGQPLGQVVQGGALHRGRERETGLRQDPRHGAGEQTEAHHRGLLLLFVGAGLEEVPRHRGRGGRVLPGGHLAHRRAGGGGRGALADRTSRTW